MKHGVETEIEKLPGCGPMIESFEQPHAASAHQPAVQSVSERVNVKQRKREQEAIGFCESPHVQQIQRIGDEIVMR